MESLACTGSLMEPTVTQVPGEHQIRELRGRVRSTQSPPIIGRDLRENGALDPIGLTG